jgi:hypothetical protein
MNELLDYTADELPVPQATVQASSKNHNFQLAWATPWQFDACVRFHVYG